MTRLGFGLNIAPKALSVILKYILKENNLDDEVEAYIDDILVPSGKNEDIRQIMLRNGFETKSPLRLCDTRALGLECQVNGAWNRRGEFHLLETLTRRGVHAWAGKAIAHYPICRWLRPAMSAIKRMSCVGQDSTRIDWDANLVEEVKAACDKLTCDLRVRGDPVTGFWSFNKSHQWKLYTDASKYALGAVLVVGNVYVEDATWLRKAGDCRHINVAELDAVLKGVGLFIPL